MIAADTSVNGIGLLDAVSTRAMGSDGAAGTHCGHFEAKFGPLQSG
ncbi:hypothetical protein [Mycolicibacterium houstonense]|nr:hypothetical protein [Mycolicibacterium houstonense]